jgi:hypothetical protein
VREQRWKEPISDIQYIRSLAISHGHVLALERGQAPGARAKSPLVQLAAFVQPESHTESRFWSVDDRGASLFATSHLALRCQGHSMDQTQTTCAAFDGTRTGFFAVDAVSRGLTPLASVTGQFFLHDTARGGWLRGRWQYAPILLQPASRAAIRVSETDRESPDYLALADTIVGAVWSGDKESTVRLYSME